MKKQSTPLSRNQEVERKCLWLLTFAVGKHRILSEAAGEGDAGDDEGTLPQCSIGSHDSALESFVKSTLSQVSLMSIQLL